MTQSKESPTTHIPYPLLSLEVGKNIIPFVNNKTKKGKKFLNDLVPLLRYGLYYDLGIIVPGVQVRGQSKDFEPDDFIIKIKEVPVYHNTIPKNSLLTRVLKDILDEKKITYQVCQHGISGDDCYWISDKYLPLNCATWDVQEFLILELAGLIRKHSEKFLPLAVVYEIIERFKEQHPNLVADTIPNVVTMVQLTDLFQALVKDEICIRDLEGIFEVLARHADPTIKTEVLVNLVKSNLDSLLLKEEHEEKFQKILNGEDAEDFEDKCAVVTLKGNDKFEVNPL